MRNIFLLIFFITSFFLHAQSPGGVPGAEIWYKATHQDLQNDEFNDFSINRIPIQPCINHEATLFNFNPSIDGELCLLYRAPLESVTTHNLFIVSEPKDDEQSYRHVGTKFNYNVPPQYRDSLSRNTYVIETQQGYASSMIANFGQHQLANVHFYGWSNYDSDKKFKSYGQEGETLFGIGPYVPFPKLPDGKKFEGLFPEYISFDRALTDNERNRVESYLALKYGITLDKNRSYKNSKNKIFWDKQNNDLFGNNIFGIGRDDISGLNQLQCESAHNRDYLVAAVVQIDSTNAAVQNKQGIANNDFLVFGDTGDQGLAAKNEQNLQLLKKVWLAQVDGESIRDTPIHFRLDLNNEFQPFIQEIKNKDLVLWMLHDRYVDNNYISEFDNGQVEYYKPFGLEFLPTGEVYAHYKEEMVYFDGDHNFYDQFTFAIGPEIIIQVRYVQWQCEGQCFDIEIVVIGGEPEYNVDLTDGVGKSVDVKFSHKEDNEFIYDAEVCGDQEYSVVVEDSNGNQAEYTFYVEERNYTLDLGPDQYLTAQQPMALLDAGQGINDPDATYQWYYNGEQINHPESTLETDEVGEYCVIVTTSDMSCRLEDCISVLHRFNADINSGSGCSEADNYISVTIYEGTPPYTTNVSGNGLNFNHAHNGDTTITDIPYTMEAATYTVTVTDATGASYQETVTLNNYSSSGSLGPNQMLSYSQPTIILDGTLPFGNNPAFTYQWFRDGNLLASTDPQLTVTTPGIYKVVVTFPDGCKGRATISIGYDLEGTIVQQSDCYEASNTLNILIDYGLPTYQTDISGTQYPSGSPYNYTQFHTGSITLSGIPYGDYTVIVTDNYGGFLYQQLSFVGLQLNIHQQLMDISQGPCASIYDEDHCGDDVPLMFGGSCSSFTLDASTLINNNNQNVTYEWFMYGSSLGVYTPDLTFEPSGECYSNPANFDPQYACDGVLPIYTVVVTDNATGCAISQSFSLRFWCPVLGGGTARPFAPSLTTKVYPNPSDPSATFYYEVSSEETFEGTVQIYDMTGSLLHQVNITGKSSYTLPFDLVASGVYFVCTKTMGTLTTDKVIIK